MNIAAIFIRRPIMTSLIMLAIFIFGVVCYGLLPVNDLPNVDFPTIQVNANLPGGQSGYHGVGSGNSAREPTLHYCRR